MFDLEDIKIKFKNSLPKRLGGADWPLQVVLFGLHSEGYLHFQGIEDLRPYVAPNGDYLYLMRSTNEKIMSPQGGLEDEKGTLVMVQVGDGEYRYASWKTNFDKSEDGTLHITDLLLDAASKAIIVSLKDDEQMKILFTKATEDHARRMQAAPAWWNNMVVGLLFFGIALGLMIGLGYYLANGDIRVLNQNIETITGPLKSIASQLGSQASTVAKPPV